MTSEILSSHLLCESYGVLRQYRLRFTRTDGSTTEIEREVYNRGPATSVLPYNCQRQSVILVRQFRPVPMVLGQDPYLIEACAGMLDGEDPATSALREAREETGVTVKNLRLVSTAYASPAAYAESVTMYVGDYDEFQAVPRTAGLEAEGEETEVLEIPLEDAFSMIADGDIVDMKTIILIQALMLERLHKKQQ